MEPPEFIQRTIPTVIRSPGFWSGKEVIARAIVDGLLSSAYLWIFWVPFITGIALPLNTALIKQSICRATEDRHNSIYIPGVTNLLVPSSFQTIQTLVDDNTSMYPQNTIQLALLWICGVVWVVVSVWLANSIITASGLDWYTVMIFNLVMAILIVIVETSFFLGVAMRFNPYNLETVYQKVLPSINDTINKFLDQGGMPSTNMIPITRPPILF